MRQKPLLYTAVITLTLMGFTGCVKLNCPLPEDLNKTVKKETLSSASASADIKRNSWSMGDLCANRISFVDNGRKWNLILVRNTKQPNGPFWYLPHDNENTALDAAVYAAKKYGGGFLAVEAGGNRYAGGKDPNRNFSAGSTYTKSIIRIIDTFKPAQMPYLALHNNKNSHRQFGGEGTVSMRVSSASTKSYPAGEIKAGSKAGMHDEDNLVFLAGRSIDRTKIQALNNIGVNVKYELVNARSYDKSMSHYTALYQSRHGYVNIEAEEGDAATQKMMIDKVMKLIYRGAL